MIRKDEQVQSEAGDLFKSGDSVSAFGERLRREREMRGVSLEEIAGTTKISTRLLRALEEERFDLLPGGIFNKGFVRAYARYLCINEDDAVADYLQAAGNGDPDLRVVAAQSEAEYTAKQDVAASHSSRRASFPFIPVLILVVAVAGASGAWHIYQDRQRDLAAKHGVDQASRLMKEPTSDRSAAKPGTSTELLQPTTNTQSTKGSDNTVSQSSQDGRGAPKKSTQAPSDTAGTSTMLADASTKTESPSSVPTGTLIASNGPLNANGTPFDITVKAKDRAWVSIKSDGKIMVRGIIKPPEIKTVHATDEVVFWTGNAGDVEVSFNGIDVPLSGGQNEERVLVFNSRGVLPQAAQ